MGRTQFLYYILFNSIKHPDRTCPYCFSGDTKLVQRKKIFVELRCCEKCNLMYRYPKDSTKKNLSFYQKAYQQGMTTDLPERNELEDLLATNFANTEKDISEKIGFVRRFSCGKTILDYGCSWGYGLHQLRRVGFNAIGFEISEPRARFGREKLGVHIISASEELNNFSPGSFDIIFCNHVLEHLPTPRIAFEVFDRLLAPEGTLLIFVPNGGSEKANRLGVRWGPMTGEKHGLTFTAKFFAEALEKFNLSPLFSSSPYVDPALIPIGQVGTLLGDELMVIARRKLNYFENTNELLEL